MEYDSPPPHQPPPGWLLLPHHVHPHAQLHAPVQPSHAARCEMAHITHTSHHPNVAHLGCSHFAPVLISERCASNSTWIGLHQQTKPDSTSEAGYTSHITHDDTRQHTQQISDCTTRKPQPTGQNQLADHAVTCFGRCTYKWVGPSRLLSCVQHSPMEIVQEHDSSRLTALH